MNSLRSALVVVASVCALLSACAGGSSSTGTAGASGSGTAGTNATGSAGTTGAAGNVGTTGSAGTTGTAGTTATGSAGTTGTAGSSATGTAGTTGSAGNVGTTGSAGASGSAGTTGTAGTTGAAGTSGSAGTTGTAGTTGSAGATGTGGRGGTGGGTAGTTGNAGRGGTTGSAGAGGGTAPVVSEDFEAASISTTLWKIEGPGTIQLTKGSDPFHGGKQALKVVGSSGRTMLVNTSVFPLPAGVVYFRVWMRFETGNWAGHVGFVESSPGAESQEVRFGGQQNAYNSNLAGDGDGLSPNPFQYPSCPLCLAPVPNQWACVRGMLDFTKNAVQLYVGDTLAVNASMKSDWHSGNGVLPKNPTQIGFGWAIYGGVANTVYYDDLAIGYQPIACQ